MLLKYKVNSLLKHPGANMWPAIIGAAIGGIVSGMGGDDETTSTTKSEPWAPAQPYLKTGMEEASNIYNTLGPTAPYTGNQIALMPDPMMQSMLGAIDYTQNSIPWYQETMLNAMMPALNTVNMPTGPVYTPGAVGSGAAMSSGSTSDPTRGVPQMSATLMGNPAEVEAGGYNYQDTLNALLNGDMNNPWLSGMATDMQNRVSQQFGDVSRGMNEQLMTGILPELENMFGGAGSLGSSRQALLQGQAIGRTNDALAREYGDMNTNLQGALAGLYGNTFENSQNRRASLSSQLAGENLQERMANAGYAQQTGLANMDAQNSASMANMQARIAELNRLAALSGSASGINSYDQLQLEKMKLQLTAAGQLNNAMYMPLQAQGAMGAAYAPYLGQTQSVLDLGTKQYYESAQAPWDALQNYTGIVTQMAGLGASSTSTEVGPGESPLSSMMGGAFLGNSMYNWWNS